MKTEWNTKACCREE